MRHSETPLTEMSEHGAETGGVGGDRMQTTLSSVVETFLRAKRLARATRYEYFSTVRKWDEWGGGRVRQDPHTGSWNAHIYLSDGRRHFVGEFGFQEEAYEACQVALSRKNPELHPVTMVHAGAHANLRFVVSQTTRPGFEPGQREPKSLVLPLHYRVSRSKSIVAIRQQTGNLDVGQPQVKTGSLRPFLHAEVHEQDAALFDGLLLESDKTMAFKEGAGGDARLGEKPGNMPAAGLVLQGAEQGPANALALMVGVHVQAIDMAILREIAEAD
jgi:AP2 domain